jgi:hypothetical protein
MAKSEASASIRDKVNDKKHYCSDYILQTLKQLNYASTYKDFGTAYRYGTLRNTVNKLASNGKILKLPKECPARFILPQWTHRPEYSSVRRNDKKGMADKIDFLLFLESLPWSPDLAVHDLKLTFEVYHLRWIGNDWQYCAKSHSYSRSFDLSYPIKVQCYDTGTVLISIESSCRPFRLDDSGLLALSSLLGEIRNALHAPCIPEPATWVIVQWHLNRDSELIQGSGLAFCLTFKDFFEDAARIYYKHALNKVRAEVNQSPRRTCKEVFEEILNRDNTQKVGGF